MALAVRRTRVHTDVLGEPLATSRSPLGALFVGFLRHVNRRDSEGGSAHTRVSNVLSADSSQQIKRDACSVQLSAYSRAARSGLCAQRSPPILSCHGWEESPQPLGMVSARLDKLHWPGAPRCVLHDFWRISRGGIHLNLDTHGVAGFHRVPFTSSRQRCVGYGRRIPLSTLVFSTNGWSRSTSKRTVLFQIAATLLPGPSLWQRVRTFRPSRGASQIIPESMAGPTQRTQAISCVLMALVKEVEEVVESSEELGALPRHICLERRQSGFQSIPVCRRAHHGSFAYLHV